ncbi:hypothetical protein ACOMHN_017333 [Nucella lapillus]
MDIGQCRWHGVGCVADKGGGVRSLGPVGPGGGGTRRTNWRRPWPTSAGGAWARAARPTCMASRPRSTLRNKVYRSAAHMDTSPALLDPEDSNSGDEAMVAALNSGLRMAELVQAGLFPYLPPFPFSLAAPVKEEEEEPDLPPRPADASLRLDHIRRRHNLKGSRHLRIKPAHIHQPRLPLITALIRHLVEQRFNLEVRKGGGGSAPHPSTPTPRGEEAGASVSSSPVMEDRKSAAISVDTLPHFLPYLPAFSPSCLSLAVPSSFEDLRIPSYKPASLHPQQPHAELADDDSRRFGKVYETSRIGETLKDIIVKSISEKMKFPDVDTQTPPMFPSASDLYPPPTFSLSDAFPLDLGKSAFRSCHSDLSQPSHPAKRIKREPYDDKELQSYGAKNGGEASRGKGSDLGGPSSREGKACGSQTSGGKSGGGGKEKKTRPKRGQYRRYNSQLLIEAVRAVQRGEMSVHRAGSYFGVPHSTLEYKVKERHLLRQKKPREGPPSSSSSTTTTTVATASTAVPSPVSASPAAPCVSVTTASSSSSSSSCCTASSMTQTSRSLMLMSAASSDSSASSPSSSSSSHHTPLTGGAKPDPPPLPPHTASPPPSSSSLSAFGFGLHKPATGELPWFQPYLVSGASPSPFDPALSLFPQGFALNTSASELLRKLQHKVQSKASPSPPFSSPEASFGFTPHPNGSSSLREGFLLYN